MKTEQNKSGRLLVMSKRDKLKSNWQIFPRIQDKWLEKVLIRLRKTTSFFPLSPLCSLPLFVVVCIFFLLLENDHRWRKQKRNRILCKHLPSISSSQINHIKKLWWWCQAFPQTRHNPRFTVDEILNWLTVGDDEKGCHQVQLTGRTGWGSDTHNFDLSWVDREIVHHKEIQTEFSSVCISSEWKGWGGIRSGDDYYPKRQLLNLFTLARENFTLFNTVEPV